jgi:hypothetical protein
MVRKYKDIELIELVEKLPTFKGWFVGLYDIWVRSNEDIFNQFDDKVYTFECTKDNQRPRFIMVCSGTSNAGAQGLKQFDTYNELGCAVLKSDTIVYNSHVFGKHRGQYDAYIQNKRFPYFRDNDKDNKSEEIGTEYTNIIGANCHRAGQHSTQIDGWSLACLVRNQRKQYDSWLIFMNKRPLTVAILKET